MKMNKEARARWRDFEHSDALRKMHKSNPEQAERFLDFVNEQYKNRIVPGNLRYRNRTEGLSKSVYDRAREAFKSKDLANDDYIRESISSYGKPQSLAVLKQSKAVNNAAKGATESAASKATNVATEVAKKGGKLGRNLAIAGSAAALIGGTAYGIHKHQQNKAKQQEAEQKTASELLEDLTDIKSRYEVYEKDADENMMEEMNKEAASIGETLKNVKSSKAFKRVAPILSDTWRGAAAGAMTGAAGGALSEYRDKDDNKVHRVRNTLRGMKNGAIMGGVGGAAYGTWKDKDHSIGNYNPNPRGHKKRASEDLDGLYKQALNATMVGGALGGYDGLKGVGKQFIQGFKGNEGNFVKNIGAGIKNVGLKGIEKGVGKAVLGAAIGAGIDGISNGLKKQDPNNPYQ